MKHLFVFAKTGFGSWAWPCERRPGTACALGAAVLLAAGLPLATIAQEAIPAAADDAATLTTPLEIGAADDADAERVDVTEQAEDPVTRLIRAGDSVDLDSLLWLQRPIVVFADSPADPQYHEQMERLTEGAAALLERDVIVLTDTDPSIKSALRKKLRPRGFMMVLMGKDGGVKLRKPQPWTVRELSRTIDKFPDRLREVEERRGS
ncbi:DUF4174 domain-containing protein [Phaeobacter sp. C3_T13_0]|uniref:DUF4174 domain-containing protein n=1 Tax=Phaeobacter cretensis TaxID=3342641 RepID=UPI0039BD0A0C